MDEITITQLAGDNT